MIDIHAHVLPHVDDGSQSWKESLYMLQKGAEDGIRGVVCTSHILDRFDSRIEADFTQKFNELQSKVARSPFKISLWLGAEIYCGTRIPPESRIATLNNNGKYVLIELPLNEIPKEAEDYFFQLSLKGKVPILAHPERNSLILERPKIAFEFVHRGILIQMNAGSLTGMFGKRVKQIAFKMMDHQLVHFIASDCHDARNRPLKLSRAYKLVRQQWGEETADLLFKNNPYKAVIGEEIVPPIPLPVENSRMKKIRRSLFKIFNSR
jgi:protein-tyrosine phosphatase